MEDNKFCTKCGALIGSGDKFCPKCGQSLDPSPESTQQYEANRSKYVSEAYQNKMILIVILSALWCIFAIYIAYTFIANIDWIIETLKSDPNAWNELMKYMTEEDLKNMFVSLGYVLVASGVCAALTAVFTAIKKYYTVALLTCIFASILGLICLFGIVGFLVVYLIVTCKDAYN